MIGRSENEGKKKSKIKGLIEWKRIGGNERMIVINEDGRIICGERGRVKNSIGRKGEERINKIEYKLIDRGKNDGIILIEKGEELERMGVEEGNGKEWRWNEEKI